MEMYQLKQMQSLPLEVKIQKSSQRIREWYEFYSGDVYVSFSGGKDSAVLLHLVRSLYPDVEAVFCDTGLEFPEIRQHVLETENVRWLKPKMNFREVMSEYGYPIISKDVSEIVEQGKRKQPTALKKLNGVDKDGEPSIFRARYKKYKYLIDAPFKISNKCCNVLKKEPAKRYEKETGNKCITGMMASEGVKRQQAYLRTGCNAFDLKRPQSQPLAFWKEEDIWSYINLFNVSYSKIYDLGYKRTGCIFCAFGAHLEVYPNRFQLLQKTHPKLWNYCMKDLDAGGLGMPKALDYIDVEWRDNFIGQVSLFD